MIKHDIYSEYWDVQGRQERNNIEQMKCAKMTWKTFESPTFQQSVLITLFKLLLYTQRELKQSVLHVVPHI